MSVKKILSKLSGLLLIVGIIIALISINYPIVLKWLTGSARLIGKPILATVYANGKVNKDIKVYHVDKYWNGELADYYILHFPDAENSRLKFMSLNKKDNYVGIPSSTNIRDYDLIVELLFQSEVGAHFTPIQDDMKGFNFDLKLRFIDNEISLVIPPNTKELKFDSLRVVF